MNYIVKEATNDIFIPMCVGGGLRTVDDVRNTLIAGADKVAINTGALRNPKLITKIADAFGSQCVVLSVQAKKKKDGIYEAYYDNGREHSGKNVIDWIKEAVEYGVSGGTASVDDIFGAVNAGASAVAIASILHYGHYNILEIKKQLRERGVDIRP